MGTLAGDWTAAKNINACIAFVPAAGRKEAKGSE